MFAVRNISGIHGSHTSQLHFYSLAFLAKKRKIMPKKKPPFKGYLCFFPDCGCHLAHLHTIWKHVRFLSETSYSRSSDIQLDFSRIVVSVCAPKGTFLDFF